jgi:hypothetical protein
MRKLLKAFERLALPFVDFLLAVVGQRRVLLGGWPNRDVVEAALSTLKEFGAESLGSKPVNLPVDIENMYFRVRGRRVRIWVEEYRHVSLWGPRAIVTELAGCVAERITVEKDEKNVA